MYMDVRAKLLNRHVKQFEGRRVRQRRHGADCGNISGLIGVSCCLHNQVEAQCRTEGCPRGVRGTSCHWGNVLHQSPQCIHGLQEQECRTHYWGEVEQACSSNCAKCEWDKGPISDPEKASYANSSCSKLEPSTSCGGNNNNC